MYEFFIPTRIKTNTLYVKGYDVYQFIRVIAVLGVMIGLGVGIAGGLYFSDIIVPVIFALLTALQPYGEPLPLTLFKTLIYAIKNHNRVWYGKEQKKEYDEVIDNDNLMYQYGIKLPEGYYDNKINQWVLFDRGHFDVYDKNGYRIRKHIILELPVIENSKKMLTFQLPTIPFTDNNNNLIQEELNTTISVKKISKKQLEKKQKKLESNE